MDKVYSSRLIIPTDCDFGVDEHRMYPGQFVNKRIEEAVKAEHDRIWAEHVALNQLQNLNNELISFLDRTTDVIIALASAAVWQPLKVYLKSWNTHDRLMGLITSFNDATKRQYDAGLVFVKTDSSDFIMLNSLVHNFARLIEEFTQADEKQLSFYGQQLVGYIRQNTTDQEAMRLYANIRASIGLGGRGNSPILLAIYHVGYQAYLESGHGWIKIAQHIWKTIKSKTFSDLSDDELLIYEAWKYADGIPFKSHDRRYNAVRDAFRNRRNVLGEPHGI